MTEEKKKKKTKINPYRMRTIDEAYLLGATLGMFGAHHFYLHRYFFGVLYMFTFGLFTVGWIIDLCRMSSLVKDANEKMENPDLKNRKMISDAYTLWFPFGIFGLHHLYMGNRDLAILYACTLGMFLVGWIADLYFMPYHIDEERRKEDKSLFVAVFFNISPFGLFGAHHFYLRRYFFGILYLCTFGLLGFGYVYDLVRIKYLVRRANLKDTRVTLDDAYILWFPLGFLGLHYYYLGRWKWGVLYSCTFGLFFIGWIVDGFRMKSLVQLRRNAPQPPDEEVLANDNANNVGQPANGEVDTMPDGGNADKMPDGGNVDTMPNSGNVDTMPDGGNVDTMPGDNDVNGTGINTQPSETEVVPSAPPESEIQSAEGQTEEAPGETIEKTNDDSGGGTGTNDNSNKTVDGTTDSGENETTKVPTILASLTPDQIPEQAST